MSFQKLRWERAINLKNTGDNYKTTELWDQAVDGNGLAVRRWNFTRRG